MNTPRKLEDIASDLDAEALDEVQRGIARASEAVDDAADPKKPDEH